MPSSKMDTTTPFCQAGTIFISRPSLAPPFFERNTIERLIRLSINSQKMLVKKSELDIYSVPSVPCCSIRFLADWTRESLVPLLIARVTSFAHVAYVWVDGKVAGKRRTCRRKSEWQATKEHRIAHNACSRIARASFTLHMYG